MALDSAIRISGWLRSGILFSLALGWVASAGPAQSECRREGDIQTCDPDTGSGGGGTIYEPPVYYPSAEEIANSRAVKINDQGVAASKRGDYREAIRLYQLALRSGLNSANTANTRRNLGFAYNGLGAELSYQEDNWEEALRWYLEAQRYYSDPVLMDNIAKVKAAIENKARRAEQQRAAETAAQEEQRAAERTQEIIRKNAQHEAELAAVQQRTSEALANLRDDLARMASDTTSTSTGGGLVFLNGTEAQAKTAPAQEPTDTSVVDARGPIGSLPPGLPRLEEVENSPGREAWLRGMDAVAGNSKNKWELAAAWFETAQLRDPTNEAIGRAVALARWTRDHNSGRPAGTGTPSKTAGSASDSALQMPQDSDLEFLFNDDYRRENVVAPIDSDLEFLFDPNAGPGGDAPATDAELMFLGGPVGFTRDSTLPPDAPLADRLRMARQNFAAEMIHWGQLREVRGGPSESALSLMELGARQAPEIPEFAEMRDAMRQRLERSRQIQPGAGNLGLAPVMPLERR